MIVFKGLTASRLRLLLLSHDCRISWMDDDNEDNEDDGDEGDGDVDNEQETAFNVYLCQEALAWLISVVVSLRCLPFG